MASETAPRVRVGLVGTSGWAEFVYLQTLKDAPDGRVVALAGRNQQRLVELAQRYGIAQTFTDWRVMLHAGELDAIIVATPDELHHDIVCEAAAAGLSVMCEKPLAMNADDSASMLAAVTHNRLPNNVMFTWRFQPAAQFLKSLVESGTIGKPIQSDFQFLMGYARNSDYHWRLDADHGTGSLGDLGVHVIDFAQWLLSPISSVNASLHNAYNRVAADGVPVAPTNDSAVMTVTFEDGSHGVLTSSLVSELGDRFIVFRASVAGTEGTLEYELIGDGQGKGTRVDLSRAGQPIEHLEIPASFSEGVVGDDLWGHLMSHPVGARQFVSNVREGNQSGPDFIDGHRAQLVIDAAFESHSEGRRVSIRPAVYSTRD
jgi:predicted dehydrogenase